MKCDLCFSSHYSELCLVQTSLISSVAFFSFSFLLRVLISLLLLRGDAVAAQAVGRISRCFLMGSGCPAGPCPLTAFWGGAHRPEAFLGRADGDPCCRIPPSGLVPPGRDAARGRPSEPHQVLPSSSAHLAGCRKREGLNMPMCASPVFKQTILSE